MQRRHATCTFECTQLVALFCSAKRAIAAAADNALLPLFTDFLTTMHTSDAFVLAVDRRHSGRIVLRPSRDPLGLGHSLGSSVADQPPGQSPNGRIALRACARATLEGNSPQLVASVPSLRCRTLVATGDGAGGLLPRSA